LDNYGKHLGEPIWEYSPLSSILQDSIVPFILMFQDREVFVNQITNQQHNCIMNTV